MVKDQRKKETCIDLIRTSGEQKKGGTRVDERINLHKAYFGSREKERKRKIIGERNVLT